MDYSRLLKDNGYPLYVYKESVVSLQLEKLKSAIFDFELFYSVKCNPNNDVISYLSKNIDGMDCASIGEVLKCREAKVKKENIFYSAPGKTYEEIAIAIDNSIIIADSINEIELINRVSNRKVSIGVRINPNTNMKSGSAFETMGGSASKFGIDEDVFFDELKKLNKLENIDIDGIHVYMGSGILDSDVILENVDRIIGIANRFRKPLKFIDFGGGFGIDYANQKQLDLNKLKLGLGSLVTKLTFYDKTRLIFESGRYLMANAGQYVTRITDIKESRGKLFYIIYGGMNGFFRPTFTNTYHQIEVLNEKKKYVKATIAGHLCTPLDVQAEDIMVKEAEVLDVLVIKDAGAYGFTMSINNFISHRIPKEIWIDSDKEKGI